MLIVFSKFVGKNRSKNKILWGQVVTCPRQNNNIIKLLIRKYICKCKKRRGAISCARNKDLDKEKIEEKIKDRIVI